MSESISPEIYSAAVRVFEKLQAVNDCHREFDAGFEDARSYGLNQELLTSLMGIGLSFRMREEAPYFDTDDLYNLSLHLKLPSIHKMAMRSWAGAFKASTQTRTMRICYSLCEALQNPIWCSVLSCDRGIVDMQVDQAENFYCYSYETEPVEHLFVGDTAALLEDLTAGFEFYMLQDSIRWELPFMNAQKVGECGGFSKMLVEKARRAGIKARHVFGILASQPYGTGHYWAEFLVEGRWLPADPLMILLLRQHARLPEQEWPITRSPGGALLPLSVIEGYDEGGAPVLSQSNIKKFFKYPLVTSHNQGLATSISLV